MPNEDMRFVQGVQLYFVRTILDQHYPDARGLPEYMVGDRFFGGWSESAAGASLRFPSTEGLRKAATRRSDQHRSEEFDTSEGGTPRPGTQRTADDVLDEILDELRHRYPERDIKFTPEFRELLCQSSTAPYLKLLENEQLAKLMAVPYMPRASAIQARQAGRAEDDWLRQAAATSLKKSIEDVARKDITALTELDLGAFGKDIDDISALSNLERLKRLRLYGTSVSDVGPLAGLTQLRDLNLQGTPVSDIGPLAGLNQLKWLNLHGTSVSDIGPLRGLRQLQRLDLSSTSISDISVLSNLTQLQWLHLMEMSISEVDAISSLTQLKELFLNNTPVSDIGALSSLMKLEMLDLGGTSVSNEAVMEFRRTHPHTAIMGIDETTGSPP